MRTLEKQLRAAGIALVMSSIATWVGNQVAHAQSAPPPTLNGEGFRANSGNTNTFNTDTSQCNSDGSGTITYFASGTATGPYSGAFIETGSVTSDGSGHITNYSANFTINSAQGTVTGSITKDPNSGARCGTALNGGSDFGGISNYKATISTPNGNYLDQGTNSNGTQILPPPGISTFDQGFISSQTQTTLIAPTSKDQCKDDGWKKYPQFKNQGLCVSFVVSITLN